MHGQHVTYLTDSNMLFDEKRSTQLQYIFCIFEVCEIYGKIIRLRKRHEERWEEKFPSLPSSSMTMFILSWKIVCISSHKHISLLWPSLNIIWNSSVRAIFTNLGVIRISNKNIVKTKQKTINLISSRGCKQSQFHSF